MRHAHGRIATIVAVAALVACVAVPADKRRSDTNCMQATYTAADGIAQTRVRRCNRLGSAAPGCMTLPAVTWVDGVKYRINRATCERVSGGRA